MNKRKRILTGIGTALVLAASYFTYEYMVYVETDNAQISAHTILIAPRVAGYVKKVNVVEGQRVKAGEVLIEIDDRDYQNALRQHRAELASLEARSQDASRTFRRIAALYAKDAVSQQQYDQGSASFNELNAKRESAAAEVSQAELNLENTRIVAPSDGFIARKSVDEGQLAAVGVPLIGFVDAGERWVNANFKETQLAGVQIGHHAYITVDAVSGRTFEGVVESISAATGATFTLLPPDNATGNFTKVVQRVPVRIKLANLTADDVAKLRAGLSAVVKVRKHGD